MIFCNFPYTLGMSGSMNNSQTTRFLHSLVSWDSQGVIFSHFGVTKMTLWVPESKFRDHFSLQTSPQNLQKATSRTKIGPQKVFFGHFAFCKSWYQMMMKTYLFVFLAGRFLTFFLEGEPLAAILCSNCPYFNTHF